MLSRLKCFISVILCLIFILSCSESTTQVISGDSTQTGTSDQTVNFFSILLESNNTLEIKWKTNNISIDDIKQIEVHFQPPGDFSYLQLSELIDPSVSTFYTDDLLTYGFGDYKIKLKAILNDLDFVTSPEYDYNFNNIKSLESILESAESLNDTFSYPEDVSVLSNGDFIMSDRVNNRVLYFDKEFFFQREFKTYNSTDLFNSPFGVCVSSNDEIGVVDTNNNRVVLFDPSQSSPSYSFVNYSSASTAYLIDCAFDSSNNLFVTDLYNNEVVKFSFSDTNYTLLSTEIFIDSSQITAPWGILVKDDDIYVVEKSEGHLSMFNQTGQLVQVIGSLGDGDSKLREPRYMQIDDNNNIYVSDSGSNDIEVFDNEGNGIGVFGIYGTDSGEFNMPRGLGVSEDLLLVVDQINNRIQVFK